MYPGYQLGELIALFLCQVLKQPIEGGRKSISSLPDYHFAFLTQGNANGTPVQRVDVPLN
jgi:hypothetical protein